MAALLTLVGVGQVELRHRRISLLSAATATDTRKLAALLPPSMPATVYFA
jgi:hypothetical protein